MPSRESPGPADFSLKPLVGFKDHDCNSLKRRAPQWSLGSRFKYAVENKSPGPATVNVDHITRFGKLSMPTTSMYKKHKENKTDPNPGPSAYNPVDTSLYKWPRPSKYTMREKTKPINSDHTPGPTGEIVSLDIYKLRAPKYPIFTKTRDVIGNKEVPGPKYDSGDSKLKTMQRDPAYTMRIKLNAGKKGERIPGPANYDTTFHNPFPRSPAYTVRRKHSEYANVMILPNDNCP